MISRFFSNSGRVLAQPKNSTFSSSVVQVPSQMGTHRIAVTLVTPDSKSAIKFPSPGEARDFFLAQRFSGKKNTGGGAILGELTSTLDRARLDDVSSPHNMIIAPGKNTINLNTNNRLEFKLSNLNWLLVVVKKKNNNNIHKSCTVTPCTPGSPFFDNDLDCVTKEDFHHYLENGINLAFLPLPGFQNQRSPQDLRDCVSFLRSQQAKRECVESMMLNVPPGPGPNNIPEIKKKRRLMIFFCNDEPPLVNNKLAGEVDGIFCPKSSESNNKELVFLQDPQPPLSCAARHIPAFFFDTSSETVNNSITSTGFVDNNASSHRRGRTRRR